MYRIIFPNFEIHYDYNATDERQALTNVLSTVEAVPFPTEEEHWTVTNMETPNEHWYVTNVAQIGDILSKLKTVLKSAFIHV